MHGILKELNVLHVLQLQKIFFVTIPSSQNVEKFAGLPSKKNFIKIFRHLDVHIKRL